MQQKHLLEKSLNYSLIKKISESNHFDKIYYGNKRAIYLYDKAIKLNEDGKELFKTLKKQNIKYVLANSEATDKKFIDIAEKFGFKIIGAFQKSTQLESSKIFAKKLMDKYNIKTAKYIVVKNKNEVDKMSFTKQIVF